MDEILSTFNQVVPGAADKAALFLNVVLDKTAEEKIGLDFAAHEDRRSRQMTLQAPIQLGSALFKGMPLTMVVHADPVGRDSLQVGWQLTEESSDMMNRSRTGTATQIAMSNRNMRPDNQRKLDAMLHAFHELVFLPVLGLLVDAIDGSQSGRGFLGVD